MSSFATAFPDSDRSAGRRSCEGSWRRRLDRLPWLYTPSRRSPSPVALREIVEYLGRKILSEVACFSAKFLASPEEVVDDCPEPLLLDLISRCFNRSTSRFSRRLRVIR